MTKDIITLGINLVLAGSLSIYQIILKDGTVYLNQEDVVKFTFSASVAGYGLILPIAFYVSSRSNTKGITILRDLIS